MTNVELRNSIDFNKLFNDGAKRLPLLTRNTQHATRNTHLSLDEAPIFLLTYTKFVNE